MAWRADEHGVLIISHAALAAALGKSEASARKLVRRVIEAGGDLPEGVHRRLGRGRDHRQSQGDKVKVKLKD